MDDAVPSRHVWAPRTCPHRPTALASLDRISLCRLLGYPEWQKARLLQQRAHEPRDLVALSQTAYSQLCLPGSLVPPRVGSSSDHPRLWPTSHLLEVPPSRLRPATTLMTLTNALRPSIRCHGLVSSCFGLHQSVTGAEAWTQQDDAFRYRYPEATWCHHSIIFTAQRPEPKTKPLALFPITTFHRHAHIQGTRKVEFSEAKRALCYFYY